MLSLLDGENVGDLDVVPTMPDDELTGATTVGFDLEPLAAFLASRFPGQASGLVLRPITGGQSNPTFLVDVGPHRLVLRKRPAGPLLPSAHAIDREVRVLDALRGTSVPVPRVILYHEGADVIGTPFYLMERLDGRVFHDCALGSVPRADRKAIYRNMAEALAGLHAVDPASVGLADFGRPGNYFARQIERWSRQWRASPSAGSIPTLDRLGRWLGDNTPPDDGRSAIAHGDFRLGNLMFASDSPCLLGILDWELSTLGHPLADLAFCCLAWHLRPEDYAGIAGLDQTAAGLPSQEEFVGWYAAAAPPTGPLLPFHLAFALYRFAVIFVGIADRARAGTAAGANAAEIGGLAPRLAACALDIVDRGCLAMSDQTGRT